MCGRVVRKPAVGVLEGSLAWPLEVMLELSGASIENEEYEAICDHF
jgi:hypothetical protein